LLWGLVYEEDGDSLARADGGLRDIGKKVRLRGSAAPTVKKGGGPGIPFCPSDPEKSNNPSTRGERFTAKVENAHGGLEG